MNRHLTPILSSNDNTKAFLPTRQEITEDFIVELNKTLDKSLRENKFPFMGKGCLSIAHREAAIAAVQQDIIDLIIDFNPTQTYKSRKR